MFTPEDVLAAYERWELKPVRGSYNVEVKDGVIYTYSKVCCPMTVLCLGKPSRGNEDPARDVLDTLREEFPGFDPVSFYRGFDGISDYSSDGGDDASYGLGEAVYALLVKEQML